MLAMLNVFSDRAVFLSTFIACELVSFVAKTFHRSGSTSIDKMFMVMCSMSCGV
jgi:hypothetical protein